MPERWTTVAEGDAYLGGNPDKIDKRIVQNGVAARKAATLWKYMASEVNQWGGKKNAGRQDRSE